MADRLERDFEARTQTWTLQSMSWVSTGLGLQVSVGDFHENSPGWVL